MIKSPVRKIIHIDMDAFYASVEQRDNPALRNRPVVVGGDPHGRGVVATCSYEARRFGVHSAMSCSRAYRLCPEAVFIRPRFPVYRGISQQIRAIFLSYTSLVEPLSLDEAYLDVTVNEAGISSATWIAQEIRRKIKAATGLTASAGVSYNKFLAKTASDVNKPDGLTVILPEQAEEFIASLPIRRIHGVGRVTEERMQRLGIHYGKDLLQCSLDDLVHYFGKAGHYFYHIARGVDGRPVVPDRVRKSVGKETTLSEDIADFNMLTTVLGDLSERLAALLAEKECRGQTLTLKVKYADFQSVTRSISREKAFENAPDLLSAGTELLHKTEAGQRAVRLLGLTVSQLQGDFVASGEAQLELPFS